jgi:predicted  nucleic acid-binding Zn-ribbon protein
VIRRTFILSGCPACGWRDWREVDERRPAHECPTPGQPMPVMEVAIAKELATQGVARPAVETVAHDLAAETTHDWLDQREEGTR